MVDSVGRDLRVNRPITRRDFLNGVSVAITSTGARLIAGAATQLDFFSSVASFSLQYRIEQLGRGR
jgi:hypothetical protein